MTDSMNPSTDDFAAMFEESAGAATLQEGIQRAILEAIPEVTEVIDATDHQQGENPYYT